MKNSATASNKIELKKMPKKKRAKRKLRLSPFFRFIVSFSVAVILFFSTLFLVNTLNNHSSAAEKAFEDGNDYFAQQLYASALDCYDEAVSLDKSNVDYRIALASCYEKSGDEQMVLKTVDDGVYLAPNEFRYPAFLIGYYVRVGKIDAAYAVSDSVTSASVKSKLNDISPSAVEITPPASYTEKVTSVTLVSDDGVDIYYTVDGTTPNLASLKYSQPIDVSEITGNYIIRAIAVNSQSMPSPLSAVNYNFNDPSKKYVFADAKIGALASASLGKNVSSITYSDLVFLTELDASVFTVEGSVETLSDLPNFKNLSKLVLIDEQNIIEYCDFTQLNSLTHLTLRNCAISNEMLSEITNCIGLTYLDLSTNFISAAGPVGKLTSLETAIFDENQINTLTPFVNCTSLKELSVAYNKISSLAPLKTMTLLQSFNGSYNSFNDIVDLGKCTALTNLKIVGNGIRNINSLASLKVLRELDISNNSISSLTPLSDAVSLRELNTSFNMIDSFAPLASLTLTSLRANNCGITELSAFANIHATTLDIGNISNSYAVLSENNSFSDLSPLALTDALKYMKIDNITTVTSLAPFSGSLTLDSVYCSGCSSLFLSDFDNTTGIKLVK